MLLVSFTDAATESGSVVLTGYENHVEIEKESISSTLKRLAFNKR